LSMYGQMHTEVEPATEFELDRMLSWHEYVLFGWTWVCTSAGTEDKESLVGPIRGCL
jgi:hypothetical protein